MTKNKIIIELDAECLIERFKAIIQELDVEKKSKYNKHKEQDPELLTRVQVCDYLKISQPTLTKNMRNGTIKYKRVGRRVLFDKDKLFKQ